MNKTVKDDRFQDPLIANSSVGKGLKNIEENGIEDELHRLEHETKGTGSLRKRICPECGKAYEVFYTPMELGFGSDS